MKRRINAAPISRLVEISLIHPLPTEMEIANAFSAVLSELSLSVKMLQLRPRLGQPFLRVCAQSIIRATHSLQSLINHSLALKPITSISGKFILGIRPLLLKIRSQLLITPIHPVKRVTLESAISLAGRLREQQRFKRATRQKHRSLHSKLSIHYSTEAPKMKFFPVPMQSA